MTYLCLTNWNLWIRMYRTVSRLPSQSDTSHQVQHLLKEQNIVFLKALFKPSASSTNCDSHFSLQLVMKHTKLMSMNHCSPMTVIEHGNLQHTPTLLPSSVQCDRSLTQTRHDDQLMQTIHSVDHQCKTSNILRSGPLMLLSSRQC